MAPRALLPLPLLHHGPQWVQSQSRWSTTTGLPTCRYAWSPRSSAAPGNKALSSRHPMAYTPVRSSLDRRPCGSMAHDSRVFMSSTFSLSLELSDDHRCFVCFSHSFVRWTNASREVWFREEYMPCVSPSHFTTGPNVCTVPETQRRRALCRTRQPLPLLLAHQTYTDGFKF